MVVINAKDVELAELYDERVRHYLGKGCDGPTASMKAMVDVERAAASDDES